ncbi:MAG: hypothetical protein IT433_01855 [Phycisphaerales bacterium]|nr:hypothetical protein [Phycisphaerales bacterium]
MRRAAACFALVGLALSAYAGTDVTRLTYQVRYYHSGHDEGWSSTLPASPGARLEVRALVSFVGTAPVAALSQLVFQPVITNWGDSHLLTNSDLGLPGPPDGIGPIGGSRSFPPGIVENQPGIYGRTSPWGVNPTTTSTFLRGHLGTGTASGMLRIAQAHITNWIGQGATSGATANNNVNGGGGVSIAQIANPSRLPSDPPFNAQTQNLVVFKFGFIVGQLSDPMVLSTPNTPEECGFNRTLENGVYVPNVRWFSNVNEAVASARSGFECQPAMIFLPAPPTFAIFTLALAPRRRRARSVHA